MPVFDPHLSRIELRQELQTCLNLKRWTRKDLARASGIEAVTVSNILNNKQLLMLYQLDAFTQALGLPAGHFYAYFKGECCSHEGRVRPLKGGEFVLKCLQLEKDEIAADFLALILEDNELARRAKLLLDIAEHIYHSPLRARALAYYEKLIQMEDKLSQRYAIARYRSFLIIREQEAYAKVIEALHPFTPHLHRLPQNLQLEAYRHLLVYYNLVEAWSPLLGYAKEMEALARKATDTTDASDGYRTSLAQALHYQAIALRGLGELEKALKKTNEYAAVHAEYAKIAEVSRTLLSIQMGDTNHIPPTLHNASSKEEVYEFLITMLEAYLKNGMVKEASECLAQHEADVTELCQLSAKDPFVRYAIHLRSLRAAYFHQVGERAKALVEIHVMLDLAEQTGNIEMLKRHTARYLKLQLKKATSL